ncbi:hemoblobin-interacting domain-containing protein [Brevibacillus sp. FIR094]|uniref:hemoblobin-interacting domain-containing protein n=1 Tax=Brevibacillus sp. FIR094 TaxID=3134809 RepID=UPI003D19993B
MRANSPVTFNIHPDKSDWRSKLTSISFESTEFIDAYDTTKPNLPFMPGRMVIIQQTGTYICTFKSTGYPDVIVTITVV